MPMTKTTIKNCTLYLGDSYEIMPEISGMHAMISDPPYGCTMNDWDQDIDLAHFWEVAKKAVISGGVFCLFCQMPFAARLYMSNPKMFRYEWIYKKPVASGFLDARKKPLRAHELVYVFCENIPPYHPQMKSGEPYHKNRPSRDTPNYGNFIRTEYDNRNGERFPTSILDVKHESTFYTSTEFTRHPTQKSVAALSCLVKTYTNPGDIVIDPFMGSGSTGVAAVRQGRKFIGIEREQKWFDVACRRIAAEYEARALLDTGTVHNLAVNSVTALQTVMQTL